MSGVALPAILGLLAFALVALFAEPIAGALSRFFSRYPLINLASERQHRLRPAIVRIGALVMLVFFFILQNIS